VRLMSTSPSGARQEMRASSKELKDNNTVAVIMRLADLYDRLADRAETRGNRERPANPVLAARGL
jgi:hypothetical protein